LATNPASHQQRKGRHGSRLAAFLCTPSQKLNLARLSPLTKLSTPRLYGIMIESNYAKLFSSILTSTIWQEDDQTLRVWIAMLALKNRHGEVAGSLPGLAHQAKVSLPACERAIAKLAAPDPYSRTPDNEGRRIEVIPGGWRVLNHYKYRDAMSEEKRRAYQAEWQRNYRLRQKGSVDNPVDKSTSRFRHADTDTEQSQPQSTKPKPKRQAMKPRKASPTCNHAASVNLCESCAPAMQGFHDEGNPA
jgi:hypothetical protein